MKKFVSLLLAAALLAAMFTVFAVPAFAAGKEKVKVPSEVHLHYTGEELTAFEDTDKYTVFDGKRTNTGGYYAILTLRNPDKYEWESTNSSNSSEVRVSFEIHQYRDNGNGCCRECGGTDRHISFVDYLEKKVNDDNSVTSEEKIRNIARVISKKDSVWGSTGGTAWYVVDENVELENRPVVKGDVHIILKDYATLTANHGITVEEGGSISFYAQTDDENTMGKLTAVTDGVTAIGGRNGADGVDAGTFNSNSGIIKQSQPGGHGETINVYFYGGNNLIKSTGAACIAGGNGGKGGKGSTTAYGSGACGGAGGNINAYFYGGKNSLESTDAACIAGGNGGYGGEAAMSSGDGGDGGAGGNINAYFYGGKNSFKSTDAACIAGGNGGNGGIAHYIDVRGASAFRCGGNGGDGGCIDTYFYGGSMLFESANNKNNTNKPCFTVGKGGSKGGNSVPKTNNQGLPGNPGNLNWNVSGEPAIKAGASAESAELINDISKYTYTNEPYLSVQYNGVSALGSVLSQGSIWIIAAVAVVAVAGAAALVVVKKKKKPAVASGENKNEE